MPQAIWTGHISFGLVNIPVKLYPATEPKDVRFHLYDRRTGKRVHYERVTRDIERASFEPEPPDDLTPPEDRYEPQTARDIEPAAYASTPLAHPVERADMVRGFELPTGDLVTVADDELVSIAPERSKTIEIEEFVDLTEI